LAIALAYLIDGNDSWVLEAGGSFGLAAETLQMRFGGPRTQSKQFERDSTVQTFLMGAINNALAAPANFFKQFIITKVSEHSRGFLSIRCSHTTVAAGVNDPGYRFVVEQAETGL
jgi:hypothetical protein